MRIAITAGCLLAATLAVAPPAHAHTAEQDDTNERYRDYVATYAPLAVAEMQNARIPASITLAQGLLESGAGTSDLARESNNHFGIKCNNGWTGPTHHSEDDDYHRGRLVQSCFRAYAHPAESYADHSAFLVGSSRYARLFELDITDYRGWARGLKSAGYATSPTYAHKLIEIIEMYELYRYDQGVEILPANPDLYASGAKPSKPTSSRDRRPVLTGASHRTTPGRSSGPRTGGSVSAKPTTAAATAAIQTINDVDYATALPGETVAELARRVDRNISELTRYNETLNSRRSGLTAGQRVFLQPKRDAFRGHAKTHRVAPDEDLQAIGDLYGVATSALRTRNHVAVGREPRTGEEIVIRGRRRNSDVVAVMPSARRRQEIEGLTRPVVEGAGGAHSAGGAGGAYSAGGAGGAASSSSSGVAASAERIEVIELPPVSRTNAPGGAASRPADSRPAPAESAPTRSSTPTRTSTSTSTPAPSRTTSPASAPPRTASQFVTVKPGETLYGISRASGVAVEEIRALNGLRDNVIKVGQRLRLSR